MTEIMNLILVNRQRTVNNEFMQSSQNTIAAANRKGLYPSDKDLLLWIAKRPSNNLRFKQIVVRDLHVCSREEANCTCKTRKCNVDDQEDPRHAGG